MTLIPELYHHGVKVPLHSPLGVTLVTCIDYQRYQAAAFENADEAISSGNLMKARREQNSHRRFHKEALMRLEKFI